MKKNLLKIFCFIFLSSLLTIQVSKAFAQETKDFKFKLGITYDISNGDKDKHQLAMWFSDSSYSGMEPAEKEGIFIVFNMHDMKMLTIMQQQKMIMTIDLGKLQQQYQQKQAENGGDKTAPKATVTKTGVTEKILGYNCDQYKITSEKSESLIWVTKELGTGFGDFSKSLMMAMNNGRGKPSGNANFPDAAGMANGVMLKMVATDLSNNKVTTLEAVNVNKDGKEINTEGYQVMNMPGK